MNAEPTPPPTPILDAARSYAARGWRVIPIRRGQKTPTFSDWPNVATTDPARIGRWYNGTNHGVGIVTGEASGLFVLDVDVGEGKLGHESMIRLEDTYGPLPDTVTARTGGGGWHFYFRWPVGQSVATSGSKLGPGLDVRGNGGQVVAPPTVHPNGTPYAWVPKLDPDHRAVAAAPEWLLDLLAPVVASHAAPTGMSGDDYNAAVRAGIAGHQLIPDDDSPAAYYCATTSWPDLLIPDGWTLAQTMRDGEQRWTRPGKDARLGISATVGHDGRDILTVFSSSVPGLDEGRSYSRFGYYAATRHLGDRGAAARSIRTTMPERHDSLSWADLRGDGGARPPPGTIERFCARCGWAFIGTDTHKCRFADDVEGDASPLVPALDPALGFAHLAHWPDLFARDPAQHDWSIWPLVPAGRGVALYAPAKAGKSYVLLAAVGAAVGGRAAFGGDPPPVAQVVLYLDYEMTEDDLRTRVEDFGYEAADLVGLHYALIPSIDPLDTRAGAETVLDLAERLGATLVVIDTFGRAVSGEENSADTVRDFYRNTGSALKGAGIAMLRADHSGKDPEKGQRGSSAKVDDVDVVWHLTRRENGVLLTRTHSRLAWVPERVDLIRSETEDGIVSFRTADGLGQTTYPAGTKATADVLDALDVPLDATRDQARQLITASTFTARTATISPALKYRRSEAERALVVIAGGLANSGDGAGDGVFADLPGTPTQREGTAEDEVQMRWSKDGTGHSETGDELARPRGDGPPLINRGSGSGPVPNDADEEDPF